MIKHLKDVLELKGKKIKLGVVGSQDEQVLKSVIEARKLELVDPVLIGDRDLTIRIAEEKDLDLSGIDIIHKLSKEDAVEAGVKMASRGEIQTLMKGIIDTSSLLRGVVNREWGIRGQGLLSHIMVYDLASYHKLLFLTDGGMNLLPSYDDKLRIIENSLRLTRALGLEKTKVAVLGPKEDLDEKIISTVDGARLREDYINGRLGKDLILDGPMGLDLAISKEAARIKSYESEVAGDADVLLVANIEMGNGIGKAMTYFGGAKSAGLVMGAEVPIILTSRADSYENKLYSIALASLVGANKN